MSIIVGGILFYNELERYDWLFDDYEQTFKEHQKHGCPINNGDSGVMCWRCEPYANGESKFVFSFKSYFGDYENILKSLIPLAVSIFISLIVFYGFGGCQLTITDKRIFGKGIFGKRVDLPIDSVSAISTISIFRLFSVSTSSGSISFFGIKNTSDVYEIINNLLINRQSKETYSQNRTSTSDTANELKKYKELLDSGIITQEEFDAKKKQLLGL